MDRFYAFLTNKSGFYPDPWLSQVMLLDFKVTNYRSIRSGTTLNLAASNYDSSLSENVSALSLRGLQGVSFLKGAALYGANGSGKSNLIRAMFELQKLVRTSHRSEAGDELEQDPFRFDQDSKDEATVYEVRFVAEGVRYHYLLAFHAERVLEEFLHAYPKGRKQEWFNRFWDDDTERYEYKEGNPDNFNLKSEQQAATKPNSLFLSVAVNTFNDQTLRPVYDWFKDTVRVLNLSVEGSIDGARTVERWRDHRPDVEKMLRHADLGIQSVEIETKPVPDEFLQKAPPELRERMTGANFTDIRMAHSGFDGALHGLELSEESSGTQRYFEVIGHWLDLMNEGHVLFVDEIETSLHHLLVRELVRLAMANERGSQLIFATHDPLLLDTQLLRRDQIYLSEKTAEGDSIIYPLNEYKKPPNSRESLVKGYLAGRYGGIPFIPSELPLDESLIPGPDGS